MLRGSRDFNSVDEYTAFVRKVVDRRNRLVMGGLEEERPHLRPLLPAPVPEYVNYRARVRKWSTIQPFDKLRSWTDLHHSFPSHREGSADPAVRRTPASALQGCLRGTNGKGAVRERGARRLPPCHRLIGAQARGLCPRYRFREQMFPTLTFRLAYGALREWCREWADGEYVRILHLTATTMESTVDSALPLILEAGGPFEYGAVKELASPAPPRAPALSLPGMPDLRVYDTLLAEVA